MATTPPLTPEERLARLEGVYDHLATQGHIGEVKAEIADLKVEIVRSAGNLKAEIADLKDSVQTLLIALFAGLALLNIILRFWPS
ncbi:MAG: hypothetical protein F4X75_23015 [Gemmatimonadetes bacterium]|nr:hypothetical protein [Gemmatimonadota bacterium]MYB71355.1 hypothetical protein [Gemmatimonadota bacterium]